MDQKELNTLLHQFVAETDNDLRKAVDETQTKKVMYLKGRKDAYNHVIRLIKGIDQSQRGQ